jgi:hypothetical protein
MRNPFSVYRPKYWNHEYRRSLYEGIAFMAVAITVHIFAGHYSASVAVDANSVRDIFLDHLPVWNLDFLIVGGAIALWVLSWWLLLVRPRHLLFAIKAIALFIIVRAFFLSLTHIGAYPHDISPGPDNVGWEFYNLLSFRGDFFFSGHTGFPFLMALILWDDDLWRPVFLAMTVIFGAVMLLAHEHYSIDVFAAPFIVYGVFHMARRIFKKDYTLLAVDSA